MYLIGSGIGSDMYERERYKGYEEDRNNATKGEGTRRDHIAHDVAFFRIPYHYHY
jgi:hypothetical protein